MVKVLIYNLHHKDAKLTKLVFISEENGIKSLDKRLDKKFIAMIKKEHNLSIELISLDEDN